jgi:phosphoribosylanthranilate isomerase
MFKIKICGITTPEDALLAADAGADAIGLNFYEKSPRCVWPNRAQEIVLALIANERDWIPRIIGVFVNQGLMELLHVSAASHVVSLQLHGDEPPELIAQLREIHNSASNLPPPKLTRHDRLPLGDTSPVRPEVVRAVRPQSGSLVEVHDYLNRCQAAGGLPHAVLVDALSPSAYGGTGQTLDWDMIHEQREKLLGLPLILAGGLTPDNVAKAIASARPDAVDVASGVESAPGKKDPAKVHDFAAAAKEAFARLERDKPK